MAWLSPVWSVSSDDPVVSVSLVLRAGLRASSSSWCVGGMNTSRRFSAFDPKQSCLERGVLAHIPDVNTEAQRCCVAGPTSHSEVRPRDGI